MEFTKSFLKEMDKLKKQNKFYDYDLRRKVNEKMYELGEDANDDCLFLFSVMEDTSDDEEFYNCIHVLASWIL